MTYSRLTDVVIIAGVSVVLSAGLLPVLSRLAHRFNLVDRPGGRKQHEHPVPMAGGLAIALAVLIALAASSFVWPASDDLNAWFMGALFAIGLVGLADDFVDVPPQTKALLQLLVIVPLVVFSHIVVARLGDLFGFGSIRLHDLAIPFTVLCMLGYINALNMLDGLDGLAGGVSVVTLAFLALIAELENRMGLVVQCLVVAGATVGFLVYNLRTPWRRRASVFLGDAGSMVLGLAVGWCGAQVTAGQVIHTAKAMSVAWVLALPVMDTLVVMARRLILRRNPFKADRIHLHYVLVDLGCSVGQATALMIALSGVYGLTGYLAYRENWPSWALFSIFVVLFSMHWVFVEIVHRRTASRRYAVPTDSVLR